MSRVSRPLQLRKEPVTLARFSSSHGNEPALDASGGHELVAHSAQSAHELDGDLTRSPVFSNLLNNAAKFSKRGSKIWLTSEISTPNSSLLSGTRESHSTAF